MKASAVASPNIALVKYWGKRDEGLNLPNNSSIGLTLDGLETHTTVEFRKDIKADELTLNGKKISAGSPEFLEYAGRFLDVARQLAGKSLRARIMSRNNFPTGAGLASSASGFAALAVAADSALGLGLDRKGLSILARRGSGSAARPIVGGFVIWNKGKKPDGTDSFAEQVAAPDHWPDFRMIVCITSDEEKKVKSRAGMARTVATSPFYKPWLDGIDEDLRQMKEGIKARDLQLVGRIAEANCLKMHATMMTTDPPIIYWNRLTLGLMEGVSRWREEGLPCYFTMDAGPQVKIICMEKDVPGLLDRICLVDGLKEIFVAGPGEGARISDSHLF